MISTIQQKSGQVRRRSGVYLTVCSTATASTDRLAIGAMLAAFLGWNRSDHHCADLASSPRRLVAKPRIARAATQNPEMHWR